MFGYALKNLPSKYVYAGYSVRKSVTVLTTEVNGEVVYDDPDWKQKQAYCKEQMKTLYPEVKRIENPHGYYVDLTPELLTLKKKLLKVAKEQKVTN